MTNQVKIYRGNDLLFTLFTALNPSIGEWIWNSDESYKVSDKHYEIKGAYLMVILFVE